MLQIDNTILSFDIFEKKFVCDLDKCKGACCVHGDSGAPLDDEEVDALDRIFPEVKLFMRIEGVEAVEVQGTSVIDSDGDKVTPLVNGEECVYVVFENGVTKCAIEKAFEAGVITFQKPVSCHLYPIRITKYADFEALNYHEWDICSPALTCGKKTNVPLYVFLREPLVRKYGEAWYEKVKLASKEVAHFRNYSK
ncbi:MAG: DUF3109 family protein [Bacteroidota bacterium]|nr:DUF3109 family protein [Bacteroidota bacterium]